MDIIQILVEHLLFVVQEWGLLPGVSVMSSLTLKAAHCFREQLKMPVWVCVKTAQEHKSKLWKPEISAPGKVIGESLVLIRKCYQPPTDVMCHVSCEAVKVLLISPLTFSHWEKVHCCFLDVHSFPFTHLHAITQTCSLMQSQSLCCAVELWCLAQRHLYGQWFTFTSL